MSNEEIETPIEVEPTINNDEAQAPPAAPAPRTRPKLDLTGARGERKKGRSMFGVLVGTLNKAKSEDKQRMASDAAKKRQLIDARLQAKLTKEQNTSRRQEEAKKDRTSANRKEEDLAVKDGILRLRHISLPYLANYLLTTDEIPTALPSSRSPSPTPSPKKSPSSHLPPRVHPPPLYYLPAKLLPSQEAFLAKRKREIESRLKEEKDEWNTEKRKGLDEVRELRERSEAARRGGEEMELDDERDLKVGDSENGRGESPTRNGNGKKTPTPERNDKDKSDSVTPMPMDQDAEGDTVEY